MALISQIYSDLTKLVNFFLLEQINQQGFREVNEHHLLVLDRCEERQAAGETVALLCVGSEGQDPVTEVEHHLNVVPSGGQVPHHQTDILEDQLPKKLNMTPPAISQYSTLKE